MRLYILHMWKRVQNEMLDEKNPLQKKALTLFWVPVRDIKIPDIFLKKNLISRNVMGFSNRA